MVLVGSNVLFDYKNSTNPIINKEISKDDAKLKEQTDQFEAIFLQKILDISIKNENPLFPKSAGSDIYHSMNNQALSRHMSGSFGYSELLFNYLKENS